MPIAITVHNGRLKVALVFTTRPCLECTLSLSTCRRFIKTVQQGRSE